MTALLKSEEDDRFYSVDEFLALELAEPCELVQGRIVPMSYTTSIHGLVQMKLGRMIGNFAEKSDLGEVIAHPAIPTVRKTGKDTVRNGDLAFVSKARMAQDIQPVFETAPELMVEIASPGNGWIEMQQKKNEYFAAGVDQVWIVTPEERSIHVYTSKLAVLIYAEESGGKLTDIPFLPGLSLELSEVFRGVDQLEAIELEKEKAREASEED